MSLRFLFCLSADSSRPLRFEDLCDDELIVSSSILRLPLDCLMRNSNVGFVLGGCHLFLIYNFYYNHHSHPGVLFRLVNAIGGRNVGGV